MIKSIWNDSSLALVALDSDHGMGFTATCLTVGENGSVIALHN